jgi:hypothetical protein
MCLSFSVFSHLVGSFGLSRAERLIDCISEDFPIGELMLSLINRARTGKTANVVMASKP